MTLDVEVGVLVEADVVEAVIATKDLATLSAVVAPLPEAKLAMAKGHATFGRS